MIDDGFGFHSDALVLRISAEFKRVGVATRAQAIAKWNRWNTQKRVDFLGKVLIGSMQFPDDDVSSNPYDIASAWTVPGPGE